MPDTLNHDEYASLEPAMKEYVRYQVLTDVKEKVTKLDESINGNGKEGLKDIVKRHDTLLEVICKVLMWGGGIFSGLLIAIFSITLRSPK